MAKGLKSIVVINKIDRGNSRIAEVIRLTQDLFLELATSVDQLDFQLLYTSAREGIAVTKLGMKGKDIFPLLDCIVEMGNPNCIARRKLEYLYLTRMSPCAKSLIR